MKKILYLMHTPWDWIKQRPHFLAEMLSETHDVLVCYPKFTRRRGMAQNKSSINRVGILRLPLSRLTLIRKINEAISRGYYAYLISRFNPDIVWVTFPEIYTLLSREAVKGRSIVYDCMDDSLEFPNIKDRYRLANKESELLNEATITITSSKHLANKMISRGCRPEKAKLVRNAFGGEIIPLKGGRSLDRRKESAFRICYFGTISDWIDLEAIQFVLENCFHVEVHFFGPEDATKLKHSRMHYHGPVKHDVLFERVRQYDCFIMPFRVNDLIRSVDPVKLYEYINFGKNIISVRYEEILRFERFVHFYKNKHELLGIVKSLSSSNTLKYSLQERDNFLKENSWSQRGRDIRAILEEMSLQ